MLTFLVKLVSTTFLSILSCTWQFAHCKIYLTVKEFSPRDAMLAQY